MYPERYATSAKIFQPIVQRPSGWRAPYATATARFVAALHPINFQKRRSVSSSTRLIRNHTAAMTSAWNGASSTLSL